MMKIRDEDWGVIIAITLLIGGVVSFIIIDRSICNNCKTNIQNNSTQGLDMEVACFHGCQQIPRTNSTQLDNCYDYCEQRYNKP